mmetsp:Transcript_129289/g.361841  ORF Transcript_129289/g.361841 Transcript_129289/m.361841 type:complete len:497 (-) Transcript_129289:88-1578(-)
MHLFEERVALPLFEDRQVQPRDAQRLCGALLRLEEARHRVQVAHHHDHFVRPDAHRLCHARAFGVPAVDDGGNAGPGACIQPRPRDALLLEVLVANDSPAERLLAIQRQGGPRYELRLKVSDGGVDRAAEAHAAGDRGRGGGHAHHRQRPGAGLDEAAEALQQRRLGAPPPQTEQHRAPVDEGPDARPAGLGEVGVGSCRAPAAAEDDAVLRKDIDRQGVAPSLREAVVVARELPEIVAQQRVLRRNPCDDAVDGEPDLPLEPRGDGVAEGVEGVHASGRLEELMDEVVPGEAAPPKVADLAERLPEGEVGGLDIDGLRLKLDAPARTRPEQRVDEVVPTPAAAPEVGGLSSRLLDGRVGGLSTADVDGLTGLAFRGDIVADADPILHPAPKELVARRLRRRGHALQGGPEALGMRELRPEPGAAAARRDRLEALQEARVGEGGVHAIAPSPCRQEADGEPHVGGEGAEPAACERDGHWRLRHLRRRRIGCRGGVR